MVVTFDLLLFIFSISFQLFFCQLLVFFFPDKRIVNEFQAMKGGSQCAIWIHSAAQDCSF